MLFSRNYQSDRKYSRRLSAVVDFPEFDLDRENFPLIAISGVLATRNPEIATALLHQEADYRSNIFGRFRIDCHEEDEHYDGGLEYTYLAINEWTPFAFLTYIALEGYYNKTKLGLEDPERLATAEKAIIKITGRGRTFKDAHYAFTKVCEKLIF